MEIYKPSDSNKGIMAVSWNGSKNEYKVLNNTDTWIPVILHGNFQHTTIDSITQRGMSYYSTSIPTYDSSIISIANTNILYTLGKLNILNLNFYPKSDISSSTVIMSNLPKPKVNVPACIVSDSTHSGRILLTTNGNIILDNTILYKNYFYNGQIIYFAS